MAQTAEKSIVVEFPTVGGIQMGGYSMFHWLTVAALLGYLWLLVKIAKPAPTAKPVKDSKAWLITQTVLAWPCAFLLGFLTLGMLGMQAQRQRPQNPNLGDSGSIGYLVGLLISILGVPLLFALSVRWTRSVMRKWRALRLPPVVEPVP
jgi:hypothetical protein